MHKKHYKLMAEAFARIRKQADENEYGHFDPSLIDEIEDEICIILAGDNPTFSYEKFTNASGRKD